MENSFSDKLGNGLLVFIGGSKCALDDEDCDCDGECDGECDGDGDGDGDEDEDDSKGPLT